MASGSARIGGLATSEPRYSSQRNASNAMPKPVYMNGYVEDTPNNYVSQIIAYKARELLRHLNKICFSSVHKIVFCNVQNVLLNVDI